MSTLDRRDFLKRCGLGLVGGVIGSVPARPLPRYRCFVHVIGPVAVHPKMAGRFAADGSFTLTGGGTFVLSFDGRSTPPIPFDAATVTIEDVISDLMS